MTRVFLFNLAINKQSHVFAVAASPFVFLAGVDVGPVALEGFDSAPAAVDRTIVADDDFVGGHGLFSLSESAVSVRVPIWELSWVDAYGGQLVAVVFDGVWHVRPFLTVDHQVIKVDDPP